MSITNLKKKLVCIRDPHQCHFCTRHFKKDQTMQADTFAENDKIWNLWTCLECLEFLQEADSEIHEALTCDGGYPENCINDFLFENGGFTIEMVDLFWEYWNDIKKHQFDFSEDHNSDASDVHFELFI